jgi:hypothetical protein
MRARRMEPICWLCRRPASLSRYLIRPCRCTRAGFGMVHEPCLNEWLGESERNRACPACRSAYPLDYAPADFFGVMGEVDLAAFGCALVQGALTLGAALSMGRYSAAGVSLTFWTALCTFDLLQTLAFRPGAGPRWWSYSTLAACIVAPLVYSPPTTRLSTVHIWVCASLVCGCLNLLRIAFHGRWTEIRGRARLKTSEDSKLL